MPTRRFKALKLNPNLPAHPSPEEAQDDSPGQHPGFLGVNIHKPCKGDTTGESSLFRPYRADLVLGT